MYPRIYKRNETDFSHNGYGFLKDLIKCEVIEEDNGMFELEGECAISSFLFEYIQEENIIKAWASEELGEQLFRIYRVQKDLNGYITFNAQHITYDLLDNFIESIEAVNVTCENALNEIFNQCAYKTPFKGYSDITHKGSIILQRVNPMEAIKGTRGSICDTFSNGPKVIKDNFNIRVNTKRGSNNNVLIAYKKNLTGFESEIDTSDLVTVIFPYATIQVEEEIIDTPEGENTASTKDEVIQLPEKYVYSEYHENYNNLKIMPIDFSGDDVVDIESLREKANNYFKNSNCDTPKVNYKVEFVPLSKTINYADYKVLEAVSMCDKVIVRDYRFNLDVEAQVIKTIHCSLTQKLLSCELGNFKHSLSNIVDDINKNQEEIIDKVDKLKIDIDSEVGRLEINIKDEVNKLESNIELTAERLESTFADTTNNLQSQITQTANSITQKVSSGEIISSINQTAESVKIQANKIQLEGTVTVGDNGRKVKIQNSDYTIMDGDSLKAFFGFRSFGENNDKYLVPKFYMGAYGFDPSKHNYFGITAYRGDGDNPESNTYAYTDLSYRCINSNFSDWSNVKLYSSGDMKLAPVKDLVITTNHIGGSYNGTGENTLATFSTANSSYFNSHLQIGAIRNMSNSNGLILADDHNSGNDGVRVRLHIDSSGNRYFRPLTTAGNIELGSGSYRWNRVFSVNADNVSSDRRLKENIEYLQETPNIHTTKSKAFNLEDMYNFVKDTLYLTSYNYKEGSKNLKFGFIAQDLLNDKIGDNIIEAQQLTDNEETSYLGYDTMNYTHTLAGALKVAINEIEKLKEEIKALKG